MNNRNIDKHLNHVNESFAKNVDKHDWKDDIFIGAIVAFIGWIFVVSLLATS